MVRLVWHAIDRIVSGLRMWRVKVMQVKELGWAWAEVHAESEWAHLAVDLARLPHIVVHVRLQSLISALLLVGVSPQVAAQCRTQEIGLGIGEEASLSGTGRTPV